MVFTDTQKEILCDHCGDSCLKNGHKKEKYNFCCNGCEVVFMLLQENDLGDYYRYEKTPGISRKKDISISFDYLENESIANSLLSFNEGGISKVTFEIPQIHCSSCLWLLENISLLNAEIIRSSVNFGSKKATITYKNENFKLKDLVELLHKIGYEPRLNFNQLDDQESKPSFDKKLIYKLGVAGFCFGNIMLLSFPEYLGFDKASYLFHIGYINIILAIPVLLYSGFDYIKSALRGIKIKDFNIDIPIALGMIALFGRSLYEILGQHGEGYLDSFSGFVFFLLIGRWFQSQTYRALDFDRNYKSYFPISANVFLNNKWISKSINLLDAGDLIRIRNHELIPADGILQRGKARIDYSFVTGESDLMSKKNGEKIFAGGRHQGESIEMTVSKSVDQSYLTQLWNEDTFLHPDQSKSNKIISKISKYFTFVVLGLAIATMLYWLNIDKSIAFNSFTSVLIVACPCALALAIPFTYGNILRILASKGLFLRKVDTIENIQDIDYIIFDKTGTITDSKNIEIDYQGRSLTPKLSSILRSSCSHSSHPLSIAIENSLNEQTLIDVENYSEKIGYGFRATCDGLEVKVGSSEYIFGTDKKKKETGVFIEFNNQYFGRYMFKHAFRENLGEVIQNLNKNYKISILSGDTSQDLDRLSSKLGVINEIHFNQSPKDKLEKIKNLQENGYKVMMIGDGLNDAGALKQANVGLVISDEENNFSPACDGIMSAIEFQNLYNYLSNIKKAKYLIYTAFVLAFLYNSIGMFFAMTGALSPVIAAILMPLSSITIIVFGIMTSWILFNKM